MIRVGIQILNTILNIVNNNNNNAIHEIYEYMFNIVEHKQAATIVISHKIYLS